MSKSKITYIGDTILEPGKHVVLCWNSSLHRSPSVNNYQQIYVPDGYRFAGYNFGSSVIGSQCCYENIVPVRVKVYEQQGERFSPELGKPVK